MALPNLGLNSEAIMYEVALEKLGQNKQPFISATGREKEKAAPSQAFIEYCESRILALDDLQDALDPNDKETIEKILEDHPVFKVIHE
jgi:hypothetical protein